MKNIIVLSDTHSYLDESILNHCYAADEIWHAGDIGSVAVYDSLNKTNTLKAVYGNIDGEEIRRICPEHLFFITEKLRVLIIHIAGSPPAFSASVKTLINKYQPDIFVYGHSHILKVLKDKGMLIINPGAAGIYGFHHVRTLIRLVADSGKITSAEVIELGPRRSTKSVG